MMKVMPLALLLGACAAQSPPVVGSSDQSCKADGLDDLVGRPGTSALGAEALKRSGAKVLRWVQPGMMVTMEFRADRLDVHLDDHQNVTKLSCG